MIRELSFDYREVVKLDATVYLATESFQEDLTEELAREHGTTASGAGQTA